ncbi:MAG: Ldh family oxidoreductase [Gemmataceae bacterium]
MPTLSAEKLKDFARRVFCGVEVPDNEAATVADSLIKSNLSGHDSHGLIRVMQYVAALQDGRLKAGADLSILSETPALVHADANWGMGPVQAHKLLDMLLPKARDLGVACGTLKHCGHIGRVGEYGEAAAAKGMGFVSTVNNHGFARAMAPPGGKVACLGTNPICLAVPTKGAPIVLDIGTSVCAEGKVRVSYNKKQPVPDGWLLDSEGRPTNDPGVLYHDPRGTILPLGGAQAYKGFGLGLLLDMLVAGLAGSPCSHPDGPNLSANAVFFLVIDVAKFAGGEHFLGEVTKLAETVKNCPRIEGVDEIVLPGEPEGKQRERRQRDGITLDEGTWSQLVNLAKTLGVEVPQACRNA